jgi:hypothetical protein
MYVFIYLGSTGVELRAWYMLGKHSTSWATPQALLKHFQVGSHTFAWDWPQTTIPLSMSSLIAGTTVTSHHAQAYGPISMGFC